MMKRRLLSLTMALALCLGLLPTTAFALDGDKAIMLGTSGISGFDTAKGGTGYDYIYFGDWDAQDGNTTSSPIKWRVLDDQTNTEADGLFLLSDGLLGTGADGGVYFDNTSPYSNTWQGSDAQAWCNTFYSGNLTTQEQGAVLATTKSDSAYTSTSSGYAYGVSSLSGDKVFFLSAEEADKSEYGFTDNAARIANYGNSAGVWWLRSPYASTTDDAGAVTYSGTVYGGYVYGDWAARPAFNLNRNSVLFTSAAVGGKIPAAGSGGNQGAVGADAIFEIGNNTGSEWKLTLLDSSRNFSISDAAINSSGDTMAFSYSNAQTGTNEYISVVIEDNGAITHYGRILQLDGTTGSASGTASLTLPAGVTLDNDTKLYVFNEQYNGGEKDDTKRTDYGSKLIKVNPTVDNTAPALSDGTATRDSETAATVKFISDEAGTCYYIAQDTEITLTNAEIAAQGTKQACSAGENEIKLDNISASAQYVAIVAQDAVGNVSQPLKISIPAYIAPSYGISASPAALNFGSKTVDYTEAPAAQTVTLTNTGNQNVTVNLPTSTNYIITAGTGFTNGKAALSPGSKARFTVQPKTVLGTGTYQETLEMTGTYSVSDDVELRFVVEQRPTGGGGSSRPTPTPTPSEQATDKIEAAKDGDTVEVTLPEGKTTLEKEVFEELAGRDVTLEIDLGDGLSWTVNGLDIPETANFADIDMGVSMNSGSVPVDIINAVTGEVGTMQLSLAHEGEFGFTLTLTAPLGSKNAGYWANLYYYNEAREKLEFQTSARIGEDGSAALVFTHASDYVIVIDDRDHTPKEFPFVDVTESDWFYEAVDYVFQRDLMNGTDSTHFTPDGTSSRAMVATILWRMAGEPQVDYAMQFADVPVSGWYTEAVRWAASEGIATGYSDTKFGPDDPVTREQFAVMLYRYAQTLGEGFTGSWSFPLNFPDAADVSEYAYEALCWMTMENVIQGMEDGGLHPQGTANRAQLATMLQRFCQAADQ